MALTGLNETDRGIIHRCLRASAEGPYFEDWEFDTLFGVTRDELRVVVAAWPNVDESNEVVALSINNALANLLSYPHGKGDQVVNDVGKLAEIEHAFRTWRQYVHG